ncbi:hypothetical protein EB796_017898 [Bugula neritina]|uniref:SEC14L2 n=1 Tax=Bugula neritina TaxID=10212 RepID=A0A7J7JDT6_BUGNE|nr:hypothetical protein EB796_017898 [Bugula neritina]
MDVDLTKKESSKLLEFKSRVADIKKPELWDEDTDLFLRRWLIARNWNIDKAEVMLRKSMEYRKKINCDTLLTDYKPPEVLEKYFVGGICGYDKEGSPVWIDVFPLLDVKDVSGNCGVHNKCVNVLSLVMCLGIECFKEIVAAFEDNYPEVLRRVYIINAPRIFVLAYNMVKNVLTARTTGKIHMLGSNWKESLLDVMDADQLPVYYGGTQVDENGDPKCPNKILYGGEVPKTYYFTHDDISADMQTVHVSRGSTKYIQLPITVSKCQIRYTIRSEKHDIGYGFLYNDLDSPSKRHSEMQVILSSTRTNTHMVQLTGVLECNQPGIYILLLDNSFSWIKGKTVRYSLEVVAPKTEDEAYTDALDVIGDDCVNLTANETEDLSGHEEAH